MTTQRNDAGGWAPLAITTGIQSMTAMALLALPAMAPRVAEAVGVSAAYVGLYVAAAYLASILASLASGAAVGRWGSIRVSQACLVLCAAGLALCALPSVATIAAGAVLVGFGYGPITPASSHLLARTTPPHRMAVVFSIKQTGVPLGGALAGAIVPSLQLVAGWQFALLFVAGASIACALVAQTLRAEFDADRDPKRRLGLGNILEPVRMVFAVPALRMLAGCSFVFSVAQLSLTTYLVTFLTQDLAYGLVAAGAVLAISQLGGVFGRVWWGYASDRWFGARRMLASLGTLMALAALAAALLQPAVPHAVVVLVLFVFGASAIGWNGVYLAEVARQAPEGRAGMATGGTLAITFLGNVLGPPLFGSVSAGFGSYRASFVVLALPLALCAVVLWRGVLRKS
ncbi:MFS transporter [Ramlibacter sp. USB13]|uniref:MFS transporter n=1 Tax=Ramlibacter cellulosilyticus TaxID=2764187 RepID=A0A923SC81_9BURK|nr:MFS transporter [Ramlibacter cellulosilyticus]MBC5784614.1 MFS transporter [Ramlibacter cellulosilyticus]